VPTTKKKVKKSRPELKIVFDSNAIFTQTGSYLLKHEVYEVITNAHDDDLIIMWYLPEVVRHERQYQLQKQSLELLPHIQKLEKLLGHNLLITDQTLIQRVHEGIEKQISDLRITVLSLDPSSVDWNRLMHHSAYRLPPFSAGEKEKGFRDALIAEAFIQLVEASPKTPSICRLVLITGDALLTEAIEKRTATAKNVHVLATVEELKGFIETLASTVSLEFIEGLKAAATTLFFRPNQPDSLYLKEEILKKIFELFGDKVHTPPEGAVDVKHVKTVVGRPRFTKKVGQRIHWVNRVILRVEAYAQQLTIPLTVSPFPPLDNYSAYLAMTPDERQSQIIDLSALPSGALSDKIVDLSRLKFVFNQEPGSESKTLYSMGEITFEVTWSVSVTTGSKLTKSKIESIDYVETTWQLA
jgi:hypothetical protein